MIPELTIIFCVEKGFLEPQALALAESIRLFCGNQGELILRAYSPRPKHHPSAATIRKLQDMGVEWVDLPLNTQLDHYPIANKVVALQHAERTSVTSHVCFLDSDKLVFGPITPRLLLPGYAIGLRPVNRKGPGSTGPGDANDAYWKELISQFDLDPSARIETVVDRERIRPYFNAGFLLSKARAGYGDRWLYVLERLLKGGHIPNGNLRCMDQIALAAVACEKHGCAQILPSHVNVPLPFSRQLTSQCAHRWQLPIISIHYYKFGRSPDFTEWCKHLQLSGEQIDFVERVLEYGL